jgi:hypothetical protein
LKKLRKQLWHKIRALTRIKMPQTNKYSKNLSKKISDPKICEIYSGDKKCGAK